jgi:membrane dipeptidase
VAFGSIFVMDRVMDGTDHPFDPEIGARGRAQVDVYRRWEDDGLVRLIRTRSGLADHLAAWETDGMPGVVVAMEGAEPIESPDELQWWFDAGVRVISTAWGPSRYSGGYAGSKGTPGGLTEVGRELVDGMKSLSIAFDLCHSSTELYWDGVHSDHPHVCVTHTTSQELLGVDRLPNAHQFSALASRGGMIGLGLGNIFADPTWFKNGKGDPVPMATFGELFELVASSAGWDHLGIGSDLDGGIGVDESPVGIDSIADIGKLAEVIPEDARAGVMGENWLRFLSEALPA